MPSLLSFERQPTIPTCMFWGMEATALSAYHGAVAGAPLAKALSSEYRPAPALRQVENVAVVRITGPLTKRPSLFAQYVGGTSYLEIADAVQLATEDPQFAGIVLEVDSSGGAAQGLTEVSDVVAAAAKKKPTVAHVGGRCMGTAYVIASQARQIFADRDDAVGGLGVAMIVYDETRRLNNQGIKAISIDTGPYKSLGVPGVPVTEAHKQYLQNIVETYFRFQLEAIALGRGSRMTLDRLRPLADGRAFLSSDAVKLGLIDGERSLSSIVAEMTGRPATMLARLLSLFQ